MTVPRKTPRRVWPKSSEVVFIGSVPLPRGLERLVSRGLAQGPEGRRAFRTKTLGTPTPRSGRLVQSL